jgi:phosphatidylglycerol:prolipoprotein diacylglycerol transferase
LTYARKNKIKILPFADSLSPAFFLAYAVGRLGCQFSGDGCWGIPSGLFTKPSFIPDFLWGNTYAHNVNREGISIPQCTESYCKVLPEAHFPTPLYETIMVSILFFIIWYFRKKLTPNFGAITGLFLMFNGLERFLIEFIRENTKYVYMGMNFSQAQYISLVMILLGGLIMYWAVYINKGKISL